MIGIDTSFLVAFEIAEHRGHASARDIAREHQGESLAIAPQVLAEFVHVVTDPRRFERPLEVGDALERSERWWSATESTPVYPEEHAIRLFLRWMTEFKLGRKRILDTMLAATYRASEVSVIASTNARDFALFPGVHPLVVPG